MHFGRGSSALLVAALALCFPTQDSRWVPLTFPVGPGCADCGLDQHSDLPKTHHRIGSLHHLFGPLGGPGVYDPKDRNHWGPTGNAPPNGGNNDGDSAHDDWNGAPGLIAALGPDLSGGGTGGGPGGGPGGNGGGPGGNGGGPGGNGGGPGDNGGGPGGNGGGPGGNGGGPGGNGGGPGGNGGGPGGGDNGGGSGNDPGGGITNVPEPASIVLLLAGLVAAGVVRRRKQ